MDNKLAQGFLAYFGHWVNIGGEEGTRMVQCSHCGKEVEVQEKYGWQVVVLFIATWLIAGLGFDLGGIKSVAIALVIAGLASRIFKKRQCPECKQTIQNTDVKQALPK